MISMTLSQICSLATQFVQGRTDLGASEVSLYANIALGTVAAQDQYRSLESVYNFSVVSGTTAVALPSDFYTDQSVSVSSGSNTAWSRRLLPINAELIDSYATARSVPQFYSVYGSSLMLGPTSDSTYSGAMRYTTKIPTLTLPGDVPVLREDYHYAIALKTAELVSAARNDSENEALNAQRYVTYITSLPNDRALRQRDKLIGASVPKWRHQ